MKKSSASQLLALVLLLAIAITAFQAVSRQVTRNSATPVCKDQKRSESKQASSAVLTGVSVIFDSMTRNLLDIAF
ncbi:MAG: hypothetical protein QM664_07365 [Flavihumibacter sp.]